VIAGRKLVSDYPSSLTSFDREDNPQVTPDLWPVYASLLRG
jgi:hypothetical protein